MKKTVLAALGFVMILGACEELYDYGNFRPNGTFTYEGRVYDVYLADRVERASGDNRVEVLQMFHQGDDPNLLINKPIATCRGTLEECRQVFGKALRELAGAGDVRAEGMGEDY